MSKIALLELASAWRTAHLDSYGSVLNHHTARFGRDRLDEFTDGLEALDTEDELKAFCAYWTDQRHEADLITLHVIAGWKERDAMERWQA